MSGQEQAPEQTAQAGVALKTTPPSTSKARELLARHYSDRFWSSLSSTSTALLLWLASILLIWGGYILPLHRTLERLDKLDRTSSRREEILELWHQKSTDLPSSAKPDEFLKMQRSQQHQQNLEDKVKANEQEELQLEKKLAKIDTPLGTLEIEKKYVPAIWSVLFAGLFTFFVQRRILLLAMIGRAIRIHVSELGDRLDDIRGLGAWAPFWLAPLPPAFEGSQVSRENIRVVLGWGPGPGWREIASLLGLLGSLSLYVSVLLISWNVIDWAGPGTGELLVLIVVSLGLVYCMLLGIFWLWRPICYDSFPDRMLADLKGRRTFLMVTGTTLLFGLGALLYPRRIMSLWGRLPGQSLLRPRYRRSIRREPLAADLRSSFRLNRVSKVVHYVDGEGWSAGAEGMVGRNLEGFDAVQVKALLPLDLEAQVSDGALRVGRVRLNRRQAAQMAERLALEAAQRGDLELALNLLRLGIGRDTELKKSSLNKPSYRLYDLYAGLAVRAGERAKGSWNELRKYVKAAWTKDVALQQRLLNWESPGRGWTEKWTQGEIPWKLPEKLGGVSADQVL